MSVHQKLLFFLDLEGRGVTVGGGDLKIFEIAGGDFKGYKGGICPDNEILSAF